MDVSDLINSARKGTVTEKEIFDTLRALKEMDFASAAITGLLASKNYSAGAIADDPEVAARLARDAAAIARAMGEELLDPHEAESTEN